MQEETEVLGENLRGQVWIENQIHIRLWPDWESNPGRISERHGNNRCANPPARLTITNLLRDLSTREKGNSRLTKLYGGPSDEKVGRYNNSPP